MMLGRALGMLLSMLLMSGGMVVALTDPTLSSRRFVGVVLVLAGGWLLAQIIRVAKKEDRNVFN